MKYLKHLCAVYFRWVSIYYGCWCGLRIWKWSITWWWSTLIKSLIDQLSYVFSLMHTIYHMLLCITSTHRRKSRSCSFRCSGIALMLRGDAIHDILALTRFFRTIFWSQQCEAVCGCLTCCFVRCRGLWQFLAPPSRLNFLPAGKLVVSASILNIRHFPYSGLRHYDDCKNWGACRFDSFQPSHFKQLFLSYGEVHGLEK